MTIRTHSVDSSVVQFARLGYDGASLQWTAPIGNWETFTAVMDVVGRYNSFDGRHIIATFKPLFDASMRIEFGREGSPVLYVSVPYWTGQRKDGKTVGSVKISDEERRAFAAQVIDWARMVHADEISVQQSPATSQEDVWGKPGPHPYRIRLWWD